MRHPVATLRCIGSGLGRHVVCEGALAEVLARAHQTSILYWPSLHFLTIEVSAFLGHGVLRPWRRVARLQKEVLISLEAPVVAAVDIAGPLTGVQRLADIKLRLVDHVLGGVRALRWPPPRRLRHLLSTTHESRQYLGHSFWLKLL